MNVLKREKIIFILFTICIAGLLLQSKINIVNAQSVEEASVDVSVDEENWEIPRYGASLNIHNPSFNEIFQSGNAEKYNKAVQLYRGLGFSQMRFPNGNEITFYDWLSPKDMYVPWGNIEHAELPSVEEMLKFAEDTDSDVIFEMTPLGLFPSSGDEGTVLNTHSFSAGSNPFYVSFSEEEIRNFVKTYTTDRKANGQNFIKYYELGNEDYAIVDTTLDRQITADEYMGVALKLVGIIKEETNNDPDIEILGISTRQGESVWNESQYRDSSDSFDYITNHTYWRNTLDWPDGDSLFALDLKATEFDIYENLFGSSIPKFAKPAITEWNYWCWGDYLHENNQKYEHALYTFGFLLTSFDYQIPISTYLAFAPDDLNDGGLLEQRDGVLVYSPPGIGINYVYENSGDIHVKTGVTSPVTNLSTSSGTKEYKDILAYASKDADNVYLLILNRGSDSIIDTAVNFIGCDYSPNEYQFKIMEANSLSSGNNEIHTSETSSVSLSSDTNISIRVHSYQAVVLTFSCSAEPNPVIPPNPVTPPGVVTPARSVRYLPQTSIGINVGLVVISLSFLIAGLVICPKIEK